MACPFQTPDRRGDLALLPGDALVVVDGLVVDEVGHGRLHCREHLSASAKVLTDLGGVGMLAAARLTPSSRPAGLNTARGIAMHQPRKQPCRRYGVAADCHVAWGCDTSARRCDQLGCDRSGVSCRPSACARPTTYIGVAGSHGYRVRPGSRLVAPWWRCRVGGALRVVGRSLWGLRRRTAAREKGMTMATLAQAQGAVLEAILEMVKEADDYSGASRAEMVLSAALAFRAVKGGPQPGSAGKS